MRVNDPHDWMRERHVAARLGLLDDAESTAYEAHLAGCPECRSAAQTFAPESGETIEVDGHVPPSLLVAVVQRNASLGVTERRVLEAHLAHCTSCREELHWLEGRAGSGRRPASSTPWLRTWAWSASAVAAALAVALFLPRPLTPAHAVTPVARPDATIELIGTPETLRTPLRGGAANGVTRVTPGPRGELVLRFEPMDRPPDVPMTVRVVGPSGRVVASIDCMHRDLDLRHTVVLTPEAGAFPAGRYDLELIAHLTGAAPETLTLGFEVAAAR